MKGRLQAPFFRAVTTASSSTSTTISRQSEGYEGVTGTIAFDDKGDIENGALTLYTCKGDKREQMAVVR